MINKKYSIILKCFVSIILLTFLYVMTSVSVAHASNEILNNGKFGITIDIYSAPYSTTYADRGRQISTAVVYGVYGCGWFASARVNQLTGKDVPLYNGASWWNNAESQGFSRGTDIPTSDKALICYKSQVSGDGVGFAHVEVIEGFIGDNVIISTGGYTPAPNNGYCAILLKDASSYLSQSNIQGFVYLTTGTPTAVLSVERKYYNPGDTVTFTFGGENTNGTYTLGIYKELDRYKTVDVNSNSYSIQLNEVASYSAYMTSYGVSGGYADSNWVDWQVLPLTAELIVDKTNCNVNDKVRLNFKGYNNNVFANGPVTLAVWCNGEYVVHQDVTEKYYDVVCDKPGEYASYMTAYGGGTYKDSNWVSWTVYPLSAELSVDKTQCNVNDKVRLSFTGNNGNTFANESITLAVWCDGEYVVHQDVSENHYDVVCDKPGEYTSYMTAYGGGTYKDSNWVSWIVYPLSAELSVDKTQCAAFDKVILSFKGKNSNTFENGRVTLAVWCDGEYVVHKDITDNYFEVLCNKPGEYTSYMTAYGGGTYKDSNWVSWTVTIPDNIITLPAFLTNIESEAFANIAAEAVKISATVNTIADDAFNPDIIIIAPAGSYAAQWAEEKDYKLITE